MMSHLKNYLDLCKLITSVCNKQPTWCTQRYAAIDIVNVTFLPIVVSPSQYSFSPKHLSSSYLLAVPSRSNYSYFSLVLFLNNISSALNSSTSLSHLPFLFRKFINAFLLLTSLSLNELKPRYNRTLEIFNNGMSL